MTRRQPITSIAATKPAQLPEPKEITTIQTTIRTFTADLADIQSFLSISFSQTRAKKVEKYLTSTLASLSTTFEFDLLSDNEQVDYLLLQSHIKRLLHQHKAATKKVHTAEELGIFGKWVEICINLVETRHNVSRQSGRQIANALQSAEQGVAQLLYLLDSKDDFGDSKKRFIMFWTIGKFEELQRALEEAVGFYQGYDPVISWWIEKPWETLSTKLTALTSALGKKTGIDGSGSADDIVGDPIGREGLLQELEAEWIAYTPEELVQIAEQEFMWCEDEMENASTALGFDRRQEALEYVKNTFVEPGQQIFVVRDLADEAVAYVERHDLITVSTVAKDYWKTTMMTPARQRVNPFFLGGEEIIVSYPTNSMSHEDKLMSMRGNNPAFSRSTVHHELIPGHHLQFYYMDRYNPHRSVFQTPFWIEGWSVYWELLLWQRGFPSEIGQEWATNEAANRIGMLFWRMHRCARIIFSIKFHLGQMTPQECIDLLVTRVGHERATAEGEVRRSLAGEYPPLYQAGYLLGAFQFQRLRRELVDNAEGPRWKEKSFHDAVMRENNVPIEILRAIFRGQKLSLDMKAQWRFKD
ncbi:putative X-Pro dipeptidyl-peptidase [Boeremia exigua]|uniref:putative X-Pro dipeptidyl-peptidase n=1 Tax=Boeremia exigua TaxID=749465 RepID=UPI001E8CB7F0|nr:putative X-Pro dipeptidyl-peptidase [Boeremia exigua]KAH6639902.1 putative X-Pro dipeptidyl-peptidase [Boeremia exigua]